MPLPTSVTCYRKTKQMRSPILFLVFNRPDTTCQVFEAIRAAKPPKLYVAADGPRLNRKGERERCEEVRQIATAVDWDCELKTLFHDENLGCKMGVSGGINWFFDNEEEGVILEDDVLPIQSFFPYCDELLERYRQDERVGVISGCNLISKRFEPHESYFFSHYNHVWGWASWRRAWQHYDVTMQAWPEWRDENGVRSISDGSSLFESYWRETFENVFLGRIDTWDYQWTFACWRIGMLTVLPASNQTHNLGFGLEATHTTIDTPDYVQDSIPMLLNIPMRHPSSVKCNIKADKLISRYIVHLTIFEDLKRKLRAIPFFVKINNLLQELNMKNNFENF